MQGKAKARGETAAAGTIHHIGIRIKKRAEILEVGLKKDHLMILKSSSDLIFLYPPHQDKAVLQEPRRHCRGFPHRPVLRTEGLHFILPRMLIAMDGIPRRTFTAIPNLDDKTSYVQLDVHCDKRIKHSKNIIMLSEDSTRT